MKIIQHLKMLLGFPIVVPAGTDFSSTTVTIKPEPPPPILENRLTIYLKDGRQISTWFTPWPEGKDMIKPFKPFYSWFFGRTGNFYMWGSPRDRILIIRSEIERFEHRVRESKR